MKSTNQIEVPKNVREEVKAIKEDIQDIAKRIQNLKGEAMHVLFEDSDQLKSAVSAIKDKVMGESKQHLMGAYGCIERHPMQTALYSFGAGILIAMLCRK